MRFLIISHALHKTKEDAIFSYAPYVLEMNLWLKYVEKVEIVAPRIGGEQTVIEIAYQHSNIHFSALPEIQFTSFKTTLTSLFKVPIIIAALIKACKRTDHIHLRCPGNIGFIGCIVQIFFPKKMKTAKYAGNWDPKAKQPLSYKLQKWILSNTFLTKNIQVLVYGDWPCQTKNVKHFFTATYRKSEIIEPLKRDYSGYLKFVFIGSLVEGKRPLLAIQIIEALHKEGIPVHLDIYGDGVLKELLEEYISVNKLEKLVILHGNQPKEVIKETLKRAHFSILPSKSEGWPKAISEPMFFGVIPIATSVSCVPYMLDFGNRGILMEANLKLDVIQIKDALKDVDTLKSMSEKAANWSQNFTLEVFETEISKLIHHS
ncbi:glycosyltransferase [Gaetbulibacter aquiaggeris]|uniref:Glycosyltransferase n=1 Tax=Gaetbulibacter aquiaggeris TaxID=1735373 RepID=A0ABW7MWU1_9FLAO